VGDSVDSLIQNTQAYQARLLQFAAESFRRQKWQPVSGIFQFMFVEHWPSINWGMLDYLRQPKAGYQALSKAYQPTLPMAFRLGKAGQLRMSVVNDLPRDFPAARLELEGGNEGSAQTWALDVPANDVRHLEAAIPLPAANARLALRLYDRTGTLIGENTYDAGYFELK
jgi:beta-mannosidase